MLGAGKAVEICDRLAIEHGDRFDVPAILRDLVVENGSFYGRCGPGQSWAA